ncbi:MAG: Spc98 family-domain-containing protein [Linnemannia gamsii]|nr:MAG: Spc98 family-domain-containing protein [Linnemannia gamsii]
MIYTEILEQPSPSDPLWVALLLSILDQASKPYRDILSRWMGITPSSRGAHDRSQLLNLSTAGISSSRLGLLDFTGHLTTTNTTVDANNTGGTSRSEGAFSIFDSYLQQSLQGLDPFGEFFVHSKRGWTWDGSELIVLSDPLEYNGEFRMSDTVPPARFLDDRLAERVMEAGKELQILVEFEPRHPLIAHDRNFPMKTNWLKWFYVQDEVVKHRKECAKARTEVLDAIGTRLENMGWISKKPTLGRQTGKQVTTDGVQESGSAQGARLLMDLDMSTFERLPGQGSTTTEPGADISLDLGLDPDLLGFFSISSTLGQSKDMSLACPNMMSFLLEPTTTVSTVAANGGLLLSPSGAATEQKQIRLERLAPLTVLAEQSLCYTIRVRASLINTCVMSLYFHDLNLLGHLEIMERFLLMRDGWFVARLGEALFEDEAGLLMRCAEASNEAAASETADSATRPGAGMNVGAKNERRSSVASTSSSTSSWRKARLTWPPRSGEVEMTLRAVLLDCFQADEADEVESSRLVGESDLLDMEIEDDGAPFQSFVLGAKKDRSVKRKKIGAEELEETLAFAVKGYDEENTICRDANALEALDFLYLDYKAPRPLRLLVFTSSAFEKYTRLFTFQLRLARVGAAMKQIYRHLRTRQKIITASFPALPPRSKKQPLPPQDAMALSRVDQARAQLQMEMRMLHRFRFEAQQIFDGLQGYIVHVAMGQTWEMFMERMRDIQRRVEDWIILGSSQGEDSTMGSCEGDHEEEEEIVFDELVGDLTSLRDEHDRVLDQMLLRSLLKRKQAPILKIIHGILNCLLRFFQMVTRLQSSSSDDIAFLGSDDRDGVEEDEEAQGVLEDILERQRVRIEKLQSLQDKFRGSCRMLVKVLKVLDERGVGVETGGGTSKIIADAPSANGGSGGFLPQLLLRLDMSGFNDN